ncbi:uncharacterized protein EDB91DRAFT_154203 [Suillus paluster]|uniref:uncharacterized protein n=1 Tax=Suillus paluster TaxID=48578 RepID=UPI001B874CF3|nr:uncharacterized protein EDB91DRAFT_154203 [Suillus paluster]KAG1723968.1 hypothetical protein EDB91DRAFT_154203 [Suillus paluster]
MQRAVIASIRILGVSIQILLHFVKLLLPPPCTTLPLSKCHQQHQVALRSMRKKEKPNLITSSSIERLDPS